MTQILEGEKVDVDIRDFDDGREKAISDLLSLCANPDVGQRCVRAARKHFSLDDGVATYDRIYRELVSTE